MSEADLYRQVVDGLRLAAAPFAVQKSVLPDFVHIPDEIVLAVDEAVVTTLTRSNLLTDAQRRALVDYDKYLGTARVCENYRDALAEVESGEWFDELRRRARSVLEVLGEEVTAPTLRGATYLRGHS